MIKKVFRCHQAAVWVRDPYVSTKKRGMERPHHHLNRLFDGSDLRHCIQVSVNFRTASASNFRCSTHLCTVKPWKNNYCIYWMYWSSPATTRCQRLCRLCMLLQKNCIKFSQIVLNSADCFVIRAKILAIMKFIQAWEQTPVSPCNIWRIGTMIPIRRSQSVE